MSETRRGDVRAWPWALVLASGTVLMIGACAHEAASPAGAGAPTTAAAAGAATGPAQADRGGGLYVANCAKCHGDAGQGSDKAPPVVGANALPLDPPATAKARKTQFHTARDVYDFAHVNMPPTAAGKLPEQDYLDVIAFALKANGVDLSGKSITPDSLSAIVLHP